MGKLAVSTILNIGSAATFVAFPFLYSASFSGSLPLLALGVVLVAFSMATPFIALRSHKKSQ